MREHPALRSLRLVSRNGGTRAGSSFPSVVDLTWLCDLGLGRGPQWASGFPETCPLLATPATAPLQDSKSVRGRVIGRNGTTLSPHTADPEAAAWGFHDDL